MQFWSHRMFFSEFNLLIYAVHEQHRDINIKKNYVSTANEFPDWDNANLDSILFFRNNEPANRIE